MSQNTALKPMETFRSDLSRMDGEFQVALPPQIKTEKFIRTVLTAVQMNPALLAADRKSLFASCMKAAQDGLLLDGRDAALVTFRTKRKGVGGREEWIDAVQYMPMTGGILKKVRNSGELSSISANVVYENDIFQYVLGDDEKIIHEPKLANQGKPIAVYAIATLRHGEKVREVMTVAQVERVRAASRSKDKGPWVDWWDEMARKTVIRRLSKRLPQSTDLDGVLSRDDWQYPTMKPGLAIEDTPAPRNLNDELGLTGPGESSANGDTATQDDTEQIVDVEVEIENAE